MFTQNRIPNHTDTWAGCSAPIQPSSSTGSRSTIGRNTGMTSSTMPTQSMKAPRNRKISIITRMMLMVGSSAPTIRFAT